MLAFVIHNQDFFCDVFVMVNKAQHDSSSKQMRDL